MFTRFEHFAASSLMGSDESPPRDNGQLAFNRSWEQVVFALAIALSKKGHYEWEDFRQSLIDTIGVWESEHQLDDPTWDYYHRWYAALEKLVIEAGLLEQSELDEKLASLLLCHQSDDSLAES
ncbi:MULTISPECIES: nitrile hydratase accessory protein [Limnospira]|uniref:Nitrile hydratase activator P14K, nhlE-like n=1 Tax=Limnospira indica PCC 8005 TaxID=376219 RepID=A0A9P1KKH4_9CYAN|nr:nitrile hydratase accessory protein [Limnospira indica]CDM97573.1 putative Nitrile hydratase activator P14K, nhlE-like [Limnospira indica PCC 8005]